MPTAVVYHLHKDLSSTAQTIMIYKAVLDVQKHHFFTLVLDAKKKGIKLDDFTKRELVSKCISFEESVHKVFGAF